MTMNLSSMMRALALLACSWLSACSAWPADGTACPDTVCSSHGTCTWKATFPTCACAPGYEGVVCGQCAMGFHRVNDGSCVEDATCAEGSCGDDGTCSLVGGRRVCAIEGRRGVQ